MSSRYFQPFALLVTVNVAILMSPRGEGTRRGPHTLRRVPPRRLSAREISHFTMARKQFRLGALKPVFASHWRA